MTPGTEVKFAWLGEKKTGKIVARKELFGGEKVFIVKDETTGTKYPINEDEVYN